MHERSKTTFALRVACRPNGRSSGLFGRRRRLCRLFLCKAMIDCCGSCHLYNCETTSQSGLIIADLFQCYWLLYLKKENYGNLKVYCNFRLVIPSLAQTALEVTEELAKKRLFSVDLEEKSPDEMTDRKRISHSPFLQYPECHNESISLAVYLCRRASSAEMAKNPFCAYYDTSESICIKRIVLPSPQLSIGCASGQRGLR
ncbi:hypothetical protein L596_007467 [Steinernema carpocapsae]|uniref:Uncharacterized protein n=1 Tax=Steinernema carpocapsae TaxID=34508 RepID=A0A4U5PA12_STECR|nr:hypothetical protein L596_007467 [Steinernema carpocapsae]